MACSGRSGQGARASPSTARSLVCALASRLAPPLHRLSLSFMARASVFLLSSSYPRSRRTPNLLCTKIHTQRTLLAGNVRATSGLAPRGWTPLSLFHKWFFFLQCFFLATFVHSSFSSSHSLAPRQVAKGLECLDVASKTLLYRRHGRSYSSIPVDARYCKHRQPPKVPYPAR